MGINISLKLVRDDLTRSLEAFLDPKRQEELAMAAIPSVALFMCCPFLGTASFDAGSLMEDARCLRPYAGLRVRSFERARSPSDPE